MAALASSAGCEETTPSGPRAQDAAVDSGRGDARAPGPDAQSDDAEAGSSGSAQCGLLDYVLVAVFREDEQILPGKLGIDESLAAQATVLSIDRGDLDDGDFSASEHGAYARLRLSTPQAKYAVVARDVASFGLREGQTVALSLEHRDDGIWPAQTRLSLEAAGELAFFYTVGSGAPDGFSQQAGATVCQGLQMCRDAVGYTWVSKALRVGGPCGDQVELSAGERGSLCGYEVLAGELRSEVEYFTCVGHGLPEPQLVLSRKAPIDDDHDAGG